MVAEVGCFVLACSLCISVSFNCKTLFSCFRFCLVHTKAQMLCFCFATRLLLLSLLIHRPRLLALVFTEQNCWVCGAPSLFLNGTIILWRSCQEARECVLLTPKIVDEQNKHWAYVFWVGIFMYGQDHLKPVLFSRVKTKNP